MTPPVEIPRSAAISDAAATLGAGLDRLDDLLLDVHSTWRGLSAVYSAPEAHIAYGALNPLVGAGDDLVTALDRAEAALATYAQTLSGLETRRAAIMTDIALIKSGADIADRVTFIYEVRAARNRFNSDAHEADEDCAAALRRLREYSWATQGALEPITGAAGGTAQGVGAELLRRYRGFLHVPGPVATFDERLLFNASVMEPTLPRVMVDGVVHVRYASGFLAPENTLLPRASSSPKISLQGWETRLQFTTTPEIGAPPKWAGYGGKALGLAGAGLTLWSVHVESYNDTITRHPDWTQEQRQQEAIVDTAVVGGAAVRWRVGRRHRGRSNRFDIPRARHADRWRRWRCGWGLARPRGCSTQRRHRARRHRPSRDHRSQR